MLCLCSHTGVLAQSHLGGRDSVHLDYIVEVDLCVSVAPVQQCGANPKCITLHSFSLTSNKHVTANRTLLNNLNLKKKLHNCSKVWVSTCC